MSVFGNQAESCSQYLSKGRPVAIDGRLDWREWQSQDGSKREAVEIVAESVQFLGGRAEGENGQRFTPDADVPADTSDFAPAAAGPGVADDDIPF